jgi:hypothetical protein
MGNSIHCIDETQDNQSTTCMPVFHAVNAYVSSLYNREYSDFMETGKVKYIKRPHPVSVACEGAFELCCPVTSTKPKFTIVRNASHD